MKTFSCPRPYFPTVRSWRPIGLVLLLALLPPARGFTQVSQIPRDDVWIVDGQGVNALLVTNGLIYIGGSFAHVAPPCPFGADVDLDQGLANLRSPRMSAAVSVVAADGKGGWYIAENYSGSGQPPTTLSHIRADRTMDPSWTPQVFGQQGSPALVYALVVTLDRVYVGGRFWGIGGAPRQHLAALDPITGQALPWDPYVGVPDSSDSSVIALAVDGQTVYIAGQLGTVMDVPREYVAAVDAGTGEPTSWNPRPSGPVSALAVSGTDLYVGGLFTSIGGQFRTNLAGFSGATGLLTPWSPNPDGNVISVVASGGLVYVAGNFTNIGGAVRPSLAAVDRETGLAAGWNPDPQGAILADPNPFLHIPPVNQITVFGGRLYVAGNFTAIGGKERQGLASFDLASGQVTPWDPALVLGSFRPIPPIVSGMVWSLAVQADRAYVGGSFRGINAVPRANLAALDAVTTAATSWNPGVVGTVNALSLSGQTLYLGGGFTEVASQPRTNLAAVDLSSGQATAWNPGANDLVKALTIHSNRLYVGGAFTAVGGAARTNLAAIGLDGTVSPWNPATGPVGPRIDFVTTVLAVGDTIYIGGDFRTVGGQPRWSLAAVDAEAGDVTPFNPGFATPLLNVQGLASDHDVVFVAGHYVGAGFSPAMVGAANTGNSTVTWEQGTGEGLYWYPSGLCLLGGLLYAGGGAALNVFDPVTGLRLAWTPAAPFSATAGIRALAPLGDSLLVGGGLSAGNLAVFPPPAPPQLTALMLGGGTVRIQVQADPGTQNVLQGSMNWTNWSPLATNAGSFFYDASNALASPATFYRTVKQP